MTLEQLMRFLQKYKEYAEYKIKIVTDCECSSRAYNIFIDEIDKNIYIYFVE